MSDNDDQQFDGDDDSGPKMVTLSRADIRKLEKAAQAGQQAQQEAATLKREMAFLQAGINPNDAKFKYFVKGYEGESSVEAIKAEAVAAGFLQAEQQAADGQPQFQPPGAPQVSPAELAAMSRANAATAAPAQPNANMDAAFQQALSGAKSPAEIMDTLTKFGVPTPGIE